MELDGEPNRTVDDDVMQPARWNHLVLAGMHRPDVSGSVFEHEPQRALLDDESTPQTVGDRMRPA